MTNDTADLLIRTVAMLRDAEPTQDAATARRNALAPMGAQSSTTNRSNPHAY